MEILKIFVVEYLFGYILQGFAFVLGIYVFNKKPLIIKQYLIANLIFIPTTIFVRMLPISMGIHTLLNLLMLFLIGIKYLKFDLYPTIRSTLILTILLLISEAGTVAVVRLLIDYESFTDIMSNTYTRALVALPTTIVFTLSVIIPFIINAKRQNNYGGVNVGKSSK